MTKASDNVFPRLLISEGGSTTTPASGNVTVYAKANGLLYSKDDAGTETALGGGGAGLGAWTNYTPTLTAVSINPTLGSSTLLGRYKALDSTTYIVKISMTVTTGGAWNAGSGEWKFSLPAGLTGAGALNMVGTVHVLDAGTARYTGSAMVASGATVIHPIAIGDATAVATRILAHNNPVTWATGDAIDIQIIVEVV